MKFGTLQIQLLVDPQLTETVCKAVTVLRTRQWLFSSKTFENPGKTRKDK